RWSARQEPAPTPQGRTAPQRFLPPAREMPANAIFISYAREDLPAVQRLKAGMDAAGLTTWFDLDRLEGGDDYDRKIRANIARCSFFVPVISANTQRRHEAYFRREWSYAVDRMRNMAGGAVFILPTCIDDTAEAAALVPDQFKALHMTRLAGGEPTPEFLSRLRELFSERGA
ncbi:MAG: toll/interleukin-1 receptor domain-containing protein, partial [Gammaproteobacteria bacterium]